MRTNGKGEVVRNFLVIAVSSLALVSSVHAQEEREVSPVLLSSSPTLPAFTPQAVRPGRDRFNNTPSLTLDGLVETLKTNKTFRKNLSKHFDIPEERLVDFVQDALIPQVLATDAKVQNYGVTKTGQIYHKNTTLKKGTRVWGLRDGTPILKWDCSNPLLMKLPVVKKRPTTPTPVGLWKERGIVPPETSLLPPTELSAPVGITLAMENPAEPPFIPSEPPLTPTLPPKTNPPASKITIARSGLPLLPIAGVVGLVVRSQGGPGPSNVPEPTTIALLGLGALGLLARRRR